MYNDSIEHAVIILQNLFSHARHSVKILTGELNKHAYARTTIVDEMNRFLEDESHTLEILFEDKDLASEGKIRLHPFLRAVAGNERVQLRHVPQDLQEMYEFHFVLMDDDGYRFEPDKGKLVAVAAFGDKKGGRNLDRLFSRLWKDSDEVPHAASA